MGDRVSRATVALLFSDLEGSTRLLQQLGPGYSAVLLRHREVLRQAFAANRGDEQGTEGDSFFVTFPTAVDAVAAATEAQLALAATTWPDGVSVKVRIGLHVGQIEIVADTIIGLAVHEAARIGSAAHGGQVLASEQLVDLAGPLDCNAPWRDLGLHDLKDLAAPVRLMQLCHQDLESEFPPVRGSGSSRNNLPAQPTTFIGRDAEVADIHERLDAARLVTVTGTGGVGKSRIALRVAADRQRRYRDGVWLIDLTRVDEPDAVVRELAATLSLGDVTRDNVADALREQELLLVIDNCEHLLDAVGDLVMAVITRCDSVTVLATSREPLGVTGETVWRVPPLRPDDALDLLAARAQSVATRFEVTDDNRAAMREVCDRLDAIPLALELAAARLGSLSVEQLASRLDQRFRLLSGGVKGSLERHRTLQATVDWSYELLDEGERALFRRLGVFTGGFDLAGAERVCADVDPIEVLELIDRLVAKSLVVADQRPHTMRYRLLETMRQFAIDRLVQADELVSTRDAHLSWASELVEEAEQTLWLGGDEAHWLRVIDDEDANIRGAFEWALDRGEISAAIWIAFGLFGWLTGRGRSRDGVEMARRVLDRGPADVDRAMACFLYMCFLSNAGTHDSDAVAAAGETAPFLSQTRHPWLAPVTQSYVAAWSYPAGDPAAAAICAERCAQLVEAVQADPPAVRAWALQPVLWAWLDAGRFDAARDVADAGLAAAAEANLSFAESRMALNRARIALADTDLDAAWRDAEHAALVSRRTGDRFVTGVAAQLLADVALRRGEVERARDLLLSALDDVADSQPPAALTALRDRLATLG